MISHAMMGKRLSLFVTVLLIGGVFAGWYFFARESRYFGTSPLRAVPVEAPFFVRIRNLGDFTSKTVKSASWQSLRPIPEVSEMFGNFLFLDSLMLKDKDQESFFRRKELIVVPVDSCRFYLLQAGSITEKNKVNAFIRNYFLAKNCISSSQDYKDASIQQYEWNENGLNRRVLFTFYQGMLMACNKLSPMLLAIDQLDKASVLEDKDYLRVNKNSTENVDINVFINHRTFPAWMAGFYADSLSTAILQPDYAKWTEVDLLLQEKQLLVSGFTVSDSSMSCYLDVFKRQIPRVGTIGRLLPSTATFVVAHNLSDPNLYFDDYSGYLKKCGKLDSYTDQLSHLSGELNTDIRKYLRENWTGEVAAIYTNFNLEEPSDNRFLLLKVKPGTNDPMVIAMKKWAIANRKNLKSTELSENERHNVWELPASCMHFGSLAGEFYFGSIRTQWMTFGDGFILMGPTPGALRRYLNLLQRNELLAEVPSYQKFMAGLARTSSFCLWAKAGPSLSFFESAVRPGTYREMKKTADGLAKIENFAWQWGYENGMVYNTACLSINPAAVLENSPFWRYPLKAKIRNKPQFVSYSTANDTKELIFQDVENNLIDLDKDGNERWKVRLESPVLGQFKMIDYRNNGEFSLLFNTREAIHLINKNGVEMTNYPIRLRAGATNEVSVFDYEGKKDYRYLVACSDRKVYNFGKNGKLTVGWQPKSTEELVEFPVHHFRSGSRDYIVFFDRSHTYILDRFGKERVKLKDEFIHSKNDISLIESKSGVKMMVTTDERGKIRMIGFDGSVKKIVTGNFSPGHLFMPVGDKGESEFLYLDKKVLYLFDHSGNLIQEHPVPLPSVQASVPIIFGKEKLIEWYTSADNKSFLVRKNGSVFDTFLPEKSNLLTIGSFDRKTGVGNIVTSESDGYLSNFQMILP